VVFNQRIMKKDSDARETEKILRDSRDTHRNRLVLRREIDNAAYSGRIRGS
jgi:hypothetical protein